MERFSLATVLAVLLLMVTAGIARAGMDYSGVARHGQVPVAGSWFVELGPEEGAGPAVRREVGRLGGAVRFEYRILPGVWNVTGLDDAGALRLAALPGVRRVLPDYVVRAGMMESAPIVRATPAQKAAAGFGAVDGAGVRICVVDTGVRHSHIVFQGRSDTQTDRDFVNNDDDASDDNGHGTHVAATAAGGDDFTVGGAPWQGIAPEATVVAVKVLSSAGNGTASWVMAGIDYCADQGPSGGRADVISLSLGGGVYPAPCDSDPMAAAANNAVDAGLVVVAAAGNDCSDTSVGSPACGSKVMAVGATWDSSGSRSPRFGCLRGTCQDRDYQVDDLACFSNRSTMVSVTAPGAAITSASYASDNGMTTFYGTSQATPHVAGLAALLLQQDGSRSPQQVRKLIEDGAVDLGAPGFDTSFGHGRMDVVSSLEGSPCGNGVCDAPGESACSCPADCGPPPTFETSCTDGTDNDCDGYLDCLDFGDCHGDPACTCGNNTCDAGEDSCTCAFDCGNPPPTESNCSDGLDNDCDGAVDGADPDCSGGTTCGDGVCEGGTETCLSCPQDCRAARGGVECCGDGQCTGHEHRMNCPIDCL